MEACEPLKLSPRALSKKQRFSLTLPSFPPLFPSSLSFPPSLCPHCPSALSSLSLLIRQFSPSSPFFSRTRSPSSTSLFSLSPPPPRIPHVPHHCLWPRAPFPFFLLPSTLPRGFSRASVLGQLKLYPGSWQDG